MYANVLDRETPKEIMLDRSLQQDPDPTPVKI